MNSQSARRISQVAYCCGGKYWRWRFADRDFRPGHEVCCQCRERLDWTSSAESSASLRHYHRNRTAFLLSGLNTRGKRYVRTPNLPEEKRAPHYRRMEREKFRRRSQRLHEAGLTTRGTKPLRVMPAIEKAWREFRAEFILPGRDFLPPLERASL